MAKKYIDADLLRKEIESAKTVYDNPNRVVHGVADAFRQDGRAAMCDDILNLIDSLQQEQQEVDLEKETKRWWKEHLHLNPENQLWMDAHQSVVFARYFYELGKNSK